MNDEWLRVGTAKFRGLTPRDGQIAILNREKMEFSIELRETRRDFLRAFHQNAGPIFEPTRPGLPLTGPIEFVQEQLRRIYDYQATDWEWRYQETGRLAPAPIPRGTR